MPRYRPVWWETALEQHASLPAEVQEQIDVRVEQLLESPIQPSSGYDKRTDQWTTIYGGGIGLIIYTVVHERQRVIILRLIQREPHPDPKSVR